MSKPLPKFGDFLADVLRAPYQPESMRRLLNFNLPDPRIRACFPSPCESEGCDACTGMHCDCACHTTKAEDEHDAEIFASKMFPEGCQCPNNGGGDCPWCQAKEDWLINDPAWRLDAVEGV